MKLRAVPYSLLGIAAALALLLTALAPLGAANLLYNPSCDGAVGLGQGEASPYDGTDAGWRLQNLSGSHMFSGPPAGKLSLHTGGTNPDTRYSQKVLVKAGASYSASVSVGLSGGTGTLQVQEYDASNNPVGTLHSVAIPDPQAGNGGYTVNNYSTVSIPAFSVDASAASVEFRLNWAAPGGAVMCRWDDAVLDGDPVATTTLTGTVKDPAGAAVDGVAISAGSSSTTSSGGSYTLTGLPVTGGPIKVTATLAGYYNEVATPVLTDGANTADFEMVPEATSNLLGNASFEAGIGPGFNVGNPSINVSPVKEWAVMGSSTSYWYIIANNYAHTGALSDAPYCYESCDYSQYQDVPVVPNTLYKAYVWLQPINLSGSGGGFGSDSGDAAGLWIQELDASGAPVVDHGKLEEKTARLDFVHKYLEFTTSANTAKVRYRLNTKLTNTMPAFNHARFRYDTAVLDGPPAPSFIGALRAKPDGSPVAMQGKVVSAAFLDPINFEDYFYAQETDRSSGIKVKVGVPTPGNLVSVEGTIETIDGERIIVASSISEGDPVGVPVPLVVAPEDAKLPPPPLGLSTVGLYITVFGKVDGTGGSIFTIDDGTGANLKVYAPEGFSATPGSYVLVTGPLGSEMSGSQVIPVLRGVSATD